MEDFIKLSKKSFNTGDFNQLRFGSHFRRRRYVTILECVGLLSLWNWDGKDVSCFLRFHCLAAEVWGWDSWLFQPPFKASLLANKLDYIRMETRTIYKASLSKRVWGARSITCLLFSIRKLSYYKNKYLKEIVVS